MKEEGWMGPKHAIRNTDLAVINTLFSLVEEVEVNVIGGHFDRQVVRNSR